MTFALLWSEARSGKFFAMEKIVGLERAWFLQGPAKSGSKSNLSEENSQ